MKKRVKTFIKSIPGVYSLFLFMLHIRTELEMRRFARMKEEEYPQALTRWFTRAMGGKPFDLENPETYHEKIQWLKIYDNTPEKTRLADKYRVRQWVAEKIGEQYLVPLLGVWENANDINFDTLPEEFVLKANHGCGWNVVVRDKSKLDIRATRQQLNKWLKMNFAFMCGFELHYKNIPPVIIAEKYIENVPGDLYDYKFLCFGGEPKYCWVDTGRNTNHRRSVFNLNFEHQPFKYGESPEIELPSIKPKNAEQMISIAKTLCEGFKLVRIDLYNIKETIYFGEMTFTPGLNKISPEEYNKILGDMIKLR